MIDLLLKEFVEPGKIKEFLARIFQCSINKVLLIDLETFNSITEEIKTENYCCLCVFSNIKGDASLLLQLYKYDIDNEKLIERIQSITKGISCYLPDKSFDKWKFINDQGSLTYVRQIDCEENECFLFEKFNAANRTRSLVKPADISELNANGVKFTSENLVATGRASSGQVVFLETGNSRAGLQYIVEQHADDFARIGVDRAQIPAVVMNAVQNGKVVGYQGSVPGRSIYEVVINGQPQRIAVTTGSNGFIVGANPSGSVR